MEIKKEVLNTVNRSFGLTRNAVSRGKLELYNHCGVFIFTLKQKKGKTSHDIDCFDYLEYSLLASSHLIYARALTGFSAVFVHSNSLFSTCLKIIILASQLSFMLKVKSITLLI